MAPAGFCDPVLGPAGETKTLTCRSDAAAGKGGRRRRNYARPPRALAPGEARSFRGPWPLETSGVAAAYVYLREGHVFLACLFVCSCSRARCPPSVPPSVAPSRLDAIVSATPRSVAASQRLPVVPLVVLQPPTVSR